MLNLLISTLTTMLVVIDPIGTAAIAVILTHSLSNSDARAIFIKAIVVATSIMIFFGILGVSILHYTGITLSAFRAAGGLLLFVTGFRMLFGMHDPTALKREDNVYADRSHIAVFPLAIPLLSGPGCITAFLLLKSQATTYEEVAIIWVGVGLALLISLICLLTAHRLVRFLGPGLIQIIIRVLGLLLSALAVQFIADGVKELFMR